MSDTQHKQSRPCNRIATGDRFKAHLRVMTLNGKPWRVITLRPGTDAAFSTNFFHDTWHIISDGGGAKLLARIFWAMSYQR
ncbi:MAG: hypothetical protein H7Y38_15145, partial [Armatimonadetes bacterium]|nr:hypothetical protein [Armatimonadota bacterium]